MKQILLRHFPSPTPLPTGGPKEVTWGEPSLNMLYTSVCRHAPGSRLLTGILEPNLCLWDPRGFRPSFSSPSFFCWWGELHCASATLQEGCEGTGDYICKTQGQLCIVVELALSSLLYFYNHLQSTTFGFCGLLFNDFSTCLQQTFCLPPLPSFPASITFQTVSNFRANIPTQYPPSILPRPRPKPYS